MDLALVPMDWLEVHLSPEVRAVPNHTRLRAVLVVRDQAAYKGEELEAVMRFSNDSDEEVCCEGIPGHAPNCSYKTGHASDCYELACLRRRGHEGEHIAMARDAGIADGVCHSCRVPIGEGHRADCTTLPTDDR